MIAIGRQSGARGLRFALGLSLILALPGCAILQGANRAVSSVTTPIIGTGSGARRGVVIADGVRFRTRVRPESEDRRTFSTATGGAARGLPQAAEAGRTQAITYCLRSFGGSQIQWIMGPDVAPEALPVGADGVLRLTGRCVVR